MDSDHDTHEHLYTLIKDFRTAMLVTRGAGGELHARPMTVAELKPDADAYFATSIETPKIAEIEADPRLLVTFQSRTQFASLTGTATIVRDRALIDKLWSAAWRVWFPGGKDDPALCLVKLQAETGEYWDNSGRQGLRYMFEGAKAVLERRQPEVDEGINAKVRL